MNEFDTPTYVLDLRDSRNRAGLESAKPGKEISVLVRPEEDDKAKPIVAKGTLNEDSTQFAVVVTTDAGIQSHVWGYEALKDALRSYRT